jgi:hypothetical protein
MRQSAVGGAAAVVLILGWCSRAAADDAVPFFRADSKGPVVYGPDLPDPVAEECGVRDRACIEAHDARVLSSALASSDPFACSNSTEPRKCMAAFDMVSGDVGMAADPILDDPCSWVVLVDHGVAVIKSTRLGVTKRYADRGWSPRSFLGRCNLSKLSAPAAETPLPLPTWTVKRPASERAGGIPVRLVPIAIPRIKPTVAPAPQIIPTAAPIPSSAGGASGGTAPAPFVPVVTKR